VPLKGCAPAVPEDAGLLQVTQTALGKISGAKRLGLAVSGGSDSMAMLHLVVRAAFPLGWQVLAVTVDHALRTEAADEARFVRHICAALGVPHQTLLWEHAEISGNIMQEAARARYALMADWAAAEGLGDVLLAHTATDQAETFLMGLAREAGLDGLTGMRPSFGHGRVSFHRPYLAQTRDELRGYLKRNGLKWVDDPTNDNERYTRTKARRALAALQPLGITEAGLARSLRHLAASQALLRQATAAAVGQVVHEKAGALWAERAAFAALGAEMGRRIFSAAVMWLSGAEHAPRAAMIERFQAAAAQGRDATLWGCRIAQKGEGFTILREARRVGGAVAQGQVWDGRWQISGAPLAGTHLCALSAEGLAARPDWRQSGLARGILLVSPALWQGDALIAAPLLDIGGEYSARLGQSFADFIISH
jgi:tRNA(Ile)-lysidine synthase